MPQIKNPPYLMAFRHISFLIIICCLSFTLSSKTTIPFAVEESFKLNFPSASSSNWKKTENGQYFVSFKLEDVAYNALFDSIGKLIEKQKVITLKELPKDVILYLDRQHEGYRMLKAFEISNIAADTLIYAVQLKDGNEKVDLYLSKDGYLLAK